ncbi:HlyD family secretion protein [Methylomonas sp. SURF-2]|uniref:HlyD family secretion protein n=1 Tax=Methylomonas subterranea TaxID=2952225 RepID=A0ABT1TDV6_9GAMM|nr:HlyD family efflux transporter periplasmic adaptor subunit [Methylomonas sp. SURF-2]MCQ8103646.1 HlyD family secretion protein [Methylomonas sp. SURF-2]
MTHDEELSHFLSQIKTDFPYARAIPLAGRLARSLLYIFLVMLIFLALTPWQQNVRGVGRVVAYAPAERQQVIAAPVDGRVSRWLVKEGGKVKQGDVVLELLDNDPLLLQRLEAERQALLGRKTAIDDRVETFRTQLRMAEEARPQALAAAESRIAMAGQRRSAAAQSLDAAQAAQKTADLNLNRQAQLREKGLSSQRTLELAQLEIAQRSAESLRAKAALQAADSEIQALNADLRKLAADTTSSIEKVRADLNKAIEDQNYLRADLLKLETRLARQQTQTIVAPQDGTIMRLLVNPGAELLKAGQAVAILIPDTAERAVELWMDGNDLPLIVTGSHSRLQFEGYPAIQFGGWPEFSVGSFGGQVSLIDASDDGQGHFRILIKPDPNDLPWPDPRFLRQGVRVNGWVLLGRVTLGYELWRIFNGFPPLVLPEPELTKQAKDAGKSAGSDEKKSYD